MVCGLGRVQFDPVSKVFLIAVSGKRVPFKCVNVLVFEKMLLHEGECTDVKEGLSLEREIVKYPSLSLSRILSRNEKVEQHIRKKTHKPNALRFRVEGDVIPLCGFGLVLIV